MALTPIPEADASDESAQALHTLGEYLELALDVGGKLILTQPRSQACVMYIGDPAGAKNDLQIYGTIEKLLADAILLSTNPGVNLVKIDNQPYRFIRSFTPIDGHDAVVFSAV